jgi:hypothetical protein
MGKRESSRGVRNSMRINTAFLTIITLLLILAVLNSQDFDDNSSITGAATTDMQQCQLQYAGKQCCYQPDSSEAEVTKILFELYDKYPNHFPKYVGNKDETIGLVMALISAETSPKFNANSISLGIAKAYKKACDEQNVGRGYGQFTFGTGAWTEAINGLSDDEVKELAGVSKQELTTLDGWRKYTIPGDNPGKEENIKKLNLLAIAEYMRQIESKLVTSFPKLEQDADTLRIGTTLTYNSGAGCQINYYQQTGSWQIKSFVTGQNVKCGETETHYNNVKAYLEKKDIPYSLGSGDITKMTEESSGSYYVRPSFETTVNYDFSDYDKIKEDLEKLRKICVEGGKENIEKCINDHIIEVSSDKFTWKLGSCDTGQKALFYSFVKAYNDCFSSMDNDCYCEADIYTDSSLNGDYSIQLDDTGAYTAYSGEYSQELEGEGFYTDISLGLFELRNMKIQLKFNKGKIEEQKFQTLLTPEKEKFVFYKNDNKVMVITMNALQKKENIPQKPSCNIRKDHFQFCVVNNEKKFPKINEAGKLEIAPITYKFAAVFKDTAPPPKITTLTVKDKTEAEKSLTLEWKKSDAEDVNRYVVYIKDEQFTDIENDGPWPVAEVPAAEVKSDSETISTSITVDEDDKTYYIAVTAVDNDNNELTNVTSLAGISLDDLGPVKPSVGNYDKENKQISIQIPTKNIDGTDVQEQELSIYIRKIPIISGQLDCRNPDYADAEKSLLLAGKPGEQKTATITLERGCYLFTAEDEKGNEKISSSSPKLDDIVSIVMVD